MRRLANSNSDHFKLNLSGLSSCYHFSPQGNAWWIFFSTSQFRREKRTKGRLQMLWQPLNWSNRSALAGPSLCCFSVRLMWGIYDLAPGHHAWDMWAGAASSCLTRLGHIEVIFPGFTQHCVRREGYPVDPIALYEGGSASMNVAFEWREASRHADSLYLLYLGNRPDATSNSHNDVIMVPPQPFPPREPLSLCVSLSLSLVPFLGTCCLWVTKESPAICCLPSYYSF